MATRRQVRRPRGPSPPPSIQGDALPVVVSVLRRGFGLLRRICCEQRAPLAQGTTFQTPSDPATAARRRQDAKASSPASADVTHRDPQASGRSPVGRAHRSQSRPRAAEGFATDAAIYREATHNLSVESMKFDDQFKEIIDRDGAALGEFKRSLTPPRGMAYSSTLTASESYAQTLAMLGREQEPVPLSKAQQRQSLAFGTGPTAKGDTKAPAPGNPLCSPWSSSTSGPPSSQPRTFADPVVEAFMQDRRRTNLAKAVEHHRSSRLGSSSATAPSAKDPEAALFAQRGAEFFAKYGMEEVGRLLEAEPTLIPQNDAGGKSAPHLPAFGGGFAQQVNTGHVGEAVQDGDELESASLGLYQASARARPAGSDAMQKAGPGSVSRAAYGPIRLSPPRGAQQPRSSSNAAKENGATQNQWLAPPRGRSPGALRLQAPVPTGRSSDKNYNSGAGLQRRFATESPADPAVARPTSGSPISIEKSLPSSPPKTPLGSPSFFSGQPHPAVASAAAAAAAARQARLAGSPAGAEAEAEVAPSPGQLAERAGLPSPPNAKAKASFGAPGPPPPPKGKGKGQHPRGNPGPPPPPKAKSKAQAIHRRHTVDVGELLEGQGVRQTSGDGVWVPSQRLYWRELQGAGEATNSIFDQADAADALDLAKSFNWDELQELFGAREDCSSAIRRRNTVSNIGVPTKDSDGSKETCVLSQRQAMSIMIITHKIGDLPHTLQRLQHLEALSEDDIGRLRELAEIVQDPVASRLRQLMAQPDAKMRSVERQLTPLLQVSRISERLRLMSLANALPGYRENLCGAAADVAMAASEICLSGALKHLIRSAVTIRDYVQEGPKALKGSSAPRVMEIGSMLSGLLQFKAAATPTEASTGRVSLLHFFVRSLLRMKPQFDEELLQQLPSLEAAMRTPWSSLCDDLAQLRSDSAFAAVEVQEHAAAYQVTSADEGGSATFQRLELLSSVASQTEDEAVQALNAAVSAMEELGRYFGIRVRESTKPTSGGILKDPPGLAVIGELHGLLQGIVRACNEVREIDSAIDPKHRSRSLSPDL